MNDERLVADLAAWLRDTEISSPDARMSAGRVMAGVEQTARSGRWWPPARFIPKVRPVPALGARHVAGATTHPISSQPEPLETKGILSLFTAPRIVAAAVVFALVGGSLFAMSNLVPESADPVAVSSPLASPTATSSLIPEPTVTPIPTPTPTSEPVAATAESTFAATRVVREFEPDADPTSLSSGLLRTSLYVDRATGTVYEIGRDGHRRTLAATADESFGVQMAAPRLVTRAGEDVVWFDEAGRVWHQSPSVGLGWLASGREDPDDVGTPAYIDPMTAAVDSVTTNRRRWEIHSVEPQSGAIISQYRGRSGALKMRSRRTRRDGQPEAIGLYVDPQQFVLTAEGVEQYENGRRIEGFALASVPGDDPDYRFIDGIGSDGKGQLWLYDATGSRVVVFDKRDGSYIDSWAPGPGQPAMTDVRGMYVTGGGTGSVATVSWITPDGLRQSALLDASLVDGSGSVAGTHDGRLEPSTREPGERAIDWHDRGLRMEADSLSLRIDGKTFIAPGEVLPDADVRLHESQLAMYWYERGIQQRLLFYLVADDTHWWVSDIWTYDGVKGDGDWIYFADLAPLTRTPLGETLEGDLRLGSTGADRKQFQKDGTGTLRIDGLRLTAFTPGTRPASLSGCDPIVDERIKGSGWSGRPLQEAGEPLEGLTEMTPAEVGAILTDLGLCHRFDYRWRTPRTIEGDKLEAHTNGWEGERRCSAPVTGEVRGLGFMSDVPHDYDSTERIVYVQVVDDEVRDWPQPPPAGTDCPSQ